MGEVCPLSSIACGAASLWTAGTWMRARLYQSGLWRQKSLRAPVISVGNISWGGTGRLLLPYGWRAGCSLRTSRFGPDPRLSSHIQKAAANSSSRHIASRCKGLWRRSAALSEASEAPGRSSASRHEAGRLLEKRFPVDLHLLDDGFQHLALRRDLDFVLVDAENPWGGHRWGPRLLRERPSALMRADGILLTRCELVTSGAGDNSPSGSLQAAVRRLNPRAQIFTLRTKLLHFVEARKADTVPAEDFHPGRPAAFCGLGNPRSFFRMLEQAGIETVVSKTFPDHHRYRSSDLELLRNLVKANRADCLLTTEKDLVNLPELNSLGTPLYWAAIEPVVDEEARLMRWIREKLDFPRERLPLSANMAGKT